MSHHHVIGGLALAFLLVASFEEWSAGHTLKEMTHGSQQGVTQVQPAPQTAPAPTVPATK
jgi:hypothetical protein